MTAVESQADFQDLEGNADTIPSVYEDQSA